MECLFKGMGIPVSFSSSSEASQSHPPQVLHLQLVLGAKEQGQGLQQELMALTLVGQVAEYLEAEWSVELEEGGTQHHGVLTTSVTGPIPSPTSIPFFFFFFFLLFSKSSNSCSEKALRASTLPYAASFKSLSLTKSSSAGVAIYLTSEKAYKKVQVVSTVLPLSTCP